MASRKHVPECPECGLLKPDHGPRCRFGAAIREGYPGRSRELWSYTGAVHAWVAASGGSSPQDVSLRLIKLAEECGEVAQAYIGMTGQNPRKGVTHTAADVASELCDVAVTALVALHDFTDDPGAFLDAYLDQRSARLTGLTVPQEVLPGDGADPQARAQRCLGCGAEAQRTAHGRMVLHTADCTATSGRIPL